jgi:thioredoxin-dependent peroxiredoxin
LATVAASAAPTLKIGKKVSDFSCASTEGPWQLSDSKGKIRVLYFYPKDSTPGCTREGTDFRDLAAQFRKAGAIIVGVSGDSLSSHQRFREKMQLPFTLLADEDRSVCQRFDVIREKNLYGRKYMGIDRSTFVIDGTGVLRHEWRKVKVPGHVEEVLRAVQAL